LVEGFVGWRGSRDGGDEQERTHLNDDGAPVDPPDRGNVATDALGNTSVSPVIHQPSGSAGPASCRGSVFEPDTLARLAAAAASTCETAVEAVVT
jgi:hypothetical protein